MKERNRFFALLLAVMMVVTYMPSMAFAAAGDEGEEAAVTEVQEDAVTEEAVQEEPSEADAQAEEPEAQTEPGAAEETPAKAEEPAAGGKQTLTLAPEVKTVEASVDLADSDELLMGYMEKSMEGKTRSGMLKASRSTRGSKLEGNNKAVYDLLKSELSQIAAGDRTDATIQLALWDINPDAYQDEYTAEDLGVNAIVEDGGITDEAAYAMDALFSFEFETVFNSLLADMPYELYWFDKTLGCMNSGPEIGASGYGDVWTANFSNPYITFYFSGGVAEEYRGNQVGSIEDGDGETVDLYEVARTDAVSTAIDNAQEIRDRYAEESDLNKLIGYKDEICSMTSYNDAAADETSDTPYGNPWQMIWVFDGDSDTEVVCEGYSKAFQFLCDNTTFNSNKIECNSVSGNMSGGTGEGPHMWNILHMDDGLNYLADITNSDEGTVGEPDQLFLKGYSYGDVTNYTYNCNGTDVSYYYDESTWNVFDQDDLTMSASDYEGTTEPDEQIVGISYSSAEPCVITEGTSGYNSTYDVDGEEVDYWCYSYNNGCPQYGDQLTTYCTSSYGDYSWLFEYQYVEGEGDFFVNTMDDNDRISADDFVIEDSNEPWEPGYHAFTFRYGGFECEIPVTIVENENPVGEISYTPAEPIELIENWHGYMHRDDAWNPETGEYEPTEEYFYYNFDPYTYIYNRGSVLTVDGVEYIYGPNDDDEWGFFNSDGDRIDAGEVSVYYEQSYENQWTIDNPVTITISYMGKSCEVTATIVESPIKSLSFVPVEPFEFIENTNGYMDGEWITDPETGEEEYVEYFQYNWDIYKEGSKFIVNGEEYIYSYREGDYYWRFYNSEGEPLELEYLGMNSDQSYDNQWTPENPGVITINYLGKICTVPVTIIENPIHSISFEPEDPIEIIENTNGYTCHDQILNDETDEWEDVEYYKYYTDAYNFMYKEGNKFTVNDVVYTYEYNEDEEEWGFYNSDGEELDTSYFSTENDQSYENQWTVDNPGTITITYMGQSCEVEARIIENPVHSISYEPVEPRTIVENSNGYMSETSVYNEETDEWEEVEYYHYSWSLYEKGDKLTINDVVYTCKYDYDEDEWVFRNSDGEIIYAYELNFDDDQSYDNQWTIDNPGTITVKYMGKECTFQIEIVENPVHSISFEPAEPAEFIENKGGWTSETEIYDPETEEYEYVEYYKYYTYDLVYSKGSKITVNDEEVYTYGRDDDRNWGFFNEDGVALDEQYLSYDDDQSYENQWSIDNPGTITVTYMGQSCTIPVTIKENPITGITFTPLHEYADLVFEVEGDWYEDDDSYYFRYNTPRFEEGDLLTVHYSDRDDVTYICDDEGERFVNVDDPKDRIYTWDDEVDCIRAYTDQEASWGLTSENEYYTTTIMYDGKETSGWKIRIVPNPVKSIAFSRNGESRIELIEGVDSYTEWDYVGEDDDEVEYLYYDYWFKKGDILTVNYENGDICEYKFTEYKDGRYTEEGFVNVEDETDILSDRYLYMRAVPPQSYQNEWKVNNTYTVNVVYYEKIAEVEAAVLKNPITNVEFKSADGSASLQLPEYVNGYWEEDEDTGEQYFWYDFPGFSEGDSLTITKNGGIRKYVFEEAAYVEDGEYYTDAFVNINDSSDVIPEWEVDRRDSNQFDPSPWEKGGSGYIYNFRYFGFDFEIPVEIIDNPVSAFEFTRDGYDEDQPIELTEGVDAWINSDGGYNRWFEYHLTFKNGDTITITDPQNNTSDYNAVPYTEGWDEAKWFENDEGKRIKPDDIYQDSDQSFKNQWKPGDGDHQINLEYYARTANVNVKIKANPVQNISFARPGSDAVELYEYGDGSWEGNSFRYQIRFKPGDELYITYLNAADPVKYVAKDSGNGKVWAFEAEGSVPEDAESVIYTYDLGFRHNRDWQLNVGEDETPTIMLMYNSMWTDVPVELVENPVESFEFVWKEGGDRVELIEGKDGYEVTYLDDNYKTFEYAIPFVEGDIIKVKYAGTDAPVEYVFNHGDDEEYGAFTASGSVPAGAPTVIGQNEINQSSIQNRHHQWSAGNDYEITLTYMGYMLDVPVTIVANGDPDDPYNINKCEVSFDEAYLKNEEIESTPYPDYFYVVHTGTILEPIVVSDGTTLGSDCYNARYTEVGFNSDANEWQIIDENNWSTSFPAETGVYFCEVSGKYPYNGTYEGLLPLIRIEGHSWNDGVVTKPATENAEGEKTFTCTICGATKTEPIPALSHTHNPVHTTAKAATCSASGNVEYWFCEGCGKYFSDSKCTNELTDNSWIIPVDVNAHAYGSWQQYDAEKHKRVCANNSSHVEYAAHVWNAGDVTKPATETEKGTKTYTCTVCGKTKEEEIPCIDYEHVEGTPVKENEKAATCTSEGSYDEVVYCTKCGEEIRRVHKTTDMIPHDEVAIPDVEPTCTEAGSTGGKKCRVCGKTTVAPQAVPAKGHNWGEATYAWNSDNTEVTGTHTCSVCGEKETAKAKRASSEVIKAPTAKEKGEIRYTSEAFAADGFEVQTKTVEIELSAEEKAIAEAIDEANDQANDASGKANAAENSTDENVVSEAEDAAAKAAALAAQAEAAAESAFDKAESAYEAAVKSGDAAQIETAKSNLDVAINNLVTAKVIKATATSSLAKAKKAAANVAAKKAAEASEAAQNATDPAVAEQLRQEAEAQAAIAAEKAASAETASAASSKAAEDLGKLAENENVDPAVKEEVKKEKAKADKSANTANESAQAAETSSEEAKASETKAEEAVEEIGRQGILDKKIPKMTIKTKTSKKTSITIKWKWTSSGKKKLKKSKATKYEIWVCPNTKFAKEDTIVKTCSKSKTSYTVKSLKKNKKYYFKIRAIKYVGGVKHVGPWSSRKYIKTKKK